MAKLEHIELINEMIAKQYIYAQKHPTADLWLYNYSKSATFDRAWNVATEQCRGIIVDKDMNIVARPFKKFFNYEEIEDKSIIPNLPFKVYEKLDGSLGILYWIGDTPYICTHGSFNSEQGAHATNVLHTKYADVIGKLDRTKTYLFEIIYPENTLVVSYGDIDDIFLLAVIDNETGEEDDIMNYSDMFKTPELYDGVNDYLKVRELFSGDNKEGFVIKFSNNFRMKLKFAEYFRLHALMSGLSEKTILQNIINGTIGDITEIISEFSEEKQIFYNNIIAKYNNIFDDIVLTCNAEYREDFATRKEAAEYFKTCTYTPIMFKMFDHADITNAVWALIWHHRSNYINETVDLEDE